MYACVCTTITTALKGRQINISLGFATTTKKKEKNKQNNSAFTCTCFQQSIPGNTVQFRWKKVHLSEKSLSGRKLKPKILDGLFQLGLSNGKKLLYTNCREIFSFKWTDYDFCTFRIVLVLSYFFYVQPCIPSLVSYPNLWRMDHIYNAMSAFKDNKRTF